MGNQEEHGLTPCSSLEETQIRRYSVPALGATGWICPPQCAQLHIRRSGVHSNCRTTISGFDPSRSGGPQVPTPLDVKTCIFPMRLSP